jgi:hypothetical protein
VRREDVVTEEPGPGLTRHRRQLLQKLAADDRNPALAEMARELLSGRATPAGVVPDRKSAA